MHMALQHQLKAEHVKVTDVSGGCGSMFDVEVVSAQFAGQSRVKQHRMVNEVRRAIERTIGEVALWTVLTTYGVFGCSCNCGCRY